MSSILTSDKLINTVKRRGFVPNSQETFTSEDLLEMATEEINLGMMALIRSVQEEYLVYSKDIQLVEGTSAYDIPYRAHGNMLRDVSIVDSDGKTVYELHRVSLDELVDFEGAYSYRNRNCFYVKNNKIVLADEAISPGYMIRMYYYLRPNKLVVNNRAGIISTITDVTEIDNINMLSGSITNISVANPTVVTSANHGLVTGDKIIVASSNSTPSIDGTRTVTVLTASTFTVDVNVTSLGSAGSWDKAVDVKEIAFTEMPDHFSSSLEYDLVQARSPNKIIDYDLTPNSINTTTGVIRFITSTSPDFEVNDYITQAEETIVPNIPTELHPVLAQKIIVACLEAMGDEQGKQSAERKLQQMEKDTLKIIGNRVEGAPKKIKARHSPLVQSVERKYIRRL